MGPCWDAVPNAPVMSHANAGEIAGVAQVGSARLSVALYSEAIPPEGPRPMLIPGETLGVVYFLPPRPPVTLAAVSAEGIVGPFKDALTKSDRNRSRVPRCASSCRPGLLRLTAGSGTSCYSTIGTAMDQLETSESYASAWTGGTGRLPSRLRGRTQPGPPGFGAGMEPHGRGFPATYHSDLVAVRVLINPVVRPVQGRSRGF